jgi:quinol monooxygenase YgiN
MSKFGMYNKFAAHSGKREQLLHQLMLAAALVDEAAGCELYVVNTSPTEPDVVWVTEIWDREEDHSASLSIEGVNELIQSTIPLLARPPEQILVVPVGGKGFKA